MVLTLLFINALRHWISLCWFFLSIFSCLERKEENNLHTIFTSSPTPPFRWSKFLLFLVQKLLQDIQQKSKTFMSKIVNPAGKRKKNAYNYFLIKCKACKVMPPILLAYLHRHCCKPHFPGRPDQPLRRMLSSHN